jgi:uncharacterized delta-60 repeat protein
MKKIPAFLVLSLVLLALCASAAAARPGALDRNFGRDGRVTVALPVKEVELPYPQKPKAARMAMGVLPGGGFAAANNQFLIERRKDGSAARGFGNGGKVPLVPPVGWKFELAGLAVDDEGRVLVAGTFASLTTSSIQDPPEYNEGREAHGPRLRMGIVTRLLPDGTLDPAFGTGGSVLGDFRQSPPTGPGPYDYEYGLPAVGLTGLALARDGGILLAGYSAEHVTGGCAPPESSATGRSFIARLRSDGSLDPGFGFNGVFTLAKVERPSPPAVSPTGGIVFDGASGYCWPRGPGETGRLVGVQSDGRLDPGFGSNGGRPHPSLQKITDVAFDSRGRLLVMGRRPETAELEGGIGDPEWRVRRLLPDGKPDPSFGPNGSASPKLPPQAHLEDLAVDGRGRIALTGYRTDKWGEHARLLLTRLSGSGAREPGFGHGGWVVTRFPTGDAAGIEVTADARNRLLVGGILGDPRFSESRGLAFARYAGR